MGIIRERQKHYKTIKYDLLETNRKVALIDLLLIAKNETGIINYDQGIREELDTFVFEVNIFTITFINVEIY